MKENMSNQAVTGRHLKYAIALFLVGSSLVGSSTAGDSGNDSWIAMIIATAAVIPLLLMYSAILRLYPGENLYAIAMHVFGRVGGTVVSIVYIFYALHLGALVLNIFAEFVHVVNMPDTPKLIIEWVCDHPLHLRTLPGYRSAGKGGPVFISCGFFHGGFHPSSGF